MKKALFSIFALAAVLVLAVSCDNKSAKSISVNYAALNYTVGQQKDSVLVVTGVGNPVGTPQWSVDDATIASITPAEPNKCTVHPLAEGTTNVNVTWDGCKASCIVTVKKAEKQ